ncbi:MAG: hemolysin family protein [Micropepsaceae bacterium]
MLFVEISVLLALIVLNGLLAMSELAVVSSRRSKLKALADEGRPGARRALALAADPGRFLSSVQIGITMVGVLAGAFSGATLGDRLGRWLIETGLSVGVAETIGFGVVIAVITYLSLVVGELVPKQIALRNPERVAMVVAPAMSVLSRLAAPFVWALDISGRLLLRLLGGTQESASNITDEEIKALMAEAESSGVIEPEERKMISGILRLGDRIARSVMTHRSDVEVIDARAGTDAIRHIIQTSVHERFPVHDGKPDEIIGVLQAKDVLDAMISGKDLDVRTMMRAAPIVPDTASVLRVLEMLQGSAVHMGLVHDEYGQFQGIVTSEDILESITGASHTDDGVPEALVVERSDGSLLVSGTKPVDELLDELGVKVQLQTSAHTAAGLVIAAMKHLPSVGESVVIAGWRFEVVDLDGRRIDKLLIQRVRDKRSGSWTQTT